MRGTGIVTKLSKLDVSRIALCKSPADQDAVFVVVKSEDEPAETSTEQPAAGAPTEPETAAPPGEVAVVEPAAEVAEPEVAKEEVATIEKSPVESASRTEEFVAPVVDEGMKECVQELVEKCNELKMVPKSVLKMVGDIAKYHGVEGPEMDGEDAFVEVVAQLRAVVDIMKGLAVTMAKPVPPQPEPPAASPEKPAAPKPVPAKKSAEEVRKEKLQEELSKVRFQLMKALGKDPCPPSE